MSKYDFETVKDRRGMGSYKWICTEKGEECEGAFPMSCADMEWVTPPQIRKACSDFAERGIYGYTVADKTYCSAVCDFMKRRHGWSIEPDWITTTYGIVSAIHTCVRAFTKEGDGVIIQSPVYGHFATAVTYNNRVVADNPLVVRDGKYEVDFEELEKLFSDPKNVMMIFCSPHNPVGRVWSEDEIRKLADLAIKYNMIIVSDEIHFDIVSKKHTVFASVSSEASAHTITCTAASKSFNIAGLGTSNIIISDEKLRSIFRGRLEKDGYECINAFAYPAIITAYTECDDWLDEMNEHLRHNYEILRNFISGYPDKVKQFCFEGTYLVWLDVSALGISDEDAVSYFAKNCGIVVNSGGWFGDCGKGFIRLNIAVPEESLLKALEGLKKAFE